MRPAGQRRRSSGKSDSGARTCGRGPAGRPATAQWCQRERPRRAPHRRRARLMARQLMAAEQILSILRGTPERLRGLTGGLAEAGLRAAAEPGQWSVTGTAAHLRSCADVWGRAIETIAATGHRPCERSARRPGSRARTIATWRSLRRGRRSGNSAIGCSLCSGSCRTRAGRGLPPWSGVAGRWSSPCIRVRTAWPVTSGLTGGRWRRQCGR